MYFSAQALQTQQTECCTFQAEGFQRKSGTTHCLKTLLPFSWIRPGTAMHIVLAKSFQKTAMNIVN